MAVPSTVPATNETHLLHHHNSKVAVSLFAGAGHSRGRVAGVQGSTTIRRRKGSIPRVRAHARDRGTCRGRGPDQDHAPPPSPGGGQGQDRGRTQIPGQDRVPDHDRAPPRHAAHHADPASRPSATRAGGPPFAPTSAHTSSCAATRKPSPRSASPPMAGGSPPPRRTARP